MKTLPLILLTIIMFSCDQRMLKTENDEMSLALMNTDIAEVAMANFDSQTQTARENANIPIDRKLIKNGSLLFEVVDIVKTEVEIEKLCKQFKGYVSTENQQNYNERLQNEQEIRVPANSFDSLIHQLERLASKVENKTIATQDVTEEFIDVEARLKVKKDVEIRYRELLKLAKTVNEMLSIESQIVNVRSEIESMEGRLNYLKSQVAFSTLKISYYETTETNFAFAAKFFVSFQHGWDNFLDFIIGVINVWPFFILLSVAILILMQWRKKIFITKTI